MYLSLSLLRSGPTIETPKNCKKWEMTWVNYNSTETNQWIFNNNEDYVLTIPCCRIQVIEFDGTSLCCCWYQPRLTWRSISNFHRSKYDAYSGLAANQDPPLRYLVWMKREYVNHWHFIFELINRQLQATLTFIFEDFRHMNFSAKFSFQLTHFHFV